MRIYKVEYYTLSKGKDQNGKEGNLRQFQDIAYIQCTDTSKIEAMLKKYFEKPRHGIYYIPHIECITEIRGHCIIEID